MKKTLFLLLTFFLLNTLIAQEKLLEQEFKIKHHKIKTDLISNETTNDFLAIIVDKKNISLNLMDNNFNLIQTVVTEKPKLNSLGYINYYYEEGIYHLYFSNNYYRNKSVFSAKENSIFHVISYDVKNKSVTKKEFSIPETKERYLSSFKRNGKLCMMFIKKKTSKFHFYTFEKENVLNDKIVDLSDYTFGTLSDKNLYKAIINPTNIEAPQLTKNPTIYFETLTDDYSNIMNQINSKIKLYPFKDKIILTVDIRKFTTRIFTFSLNDLSYEYREIEHPKTICDNESSVDSNSFLMNGKLFQISNCKKQVSLAIYDLNKKEFVKTFQAKKEDGISFKNSPFIQGGGLYFLNPEDEKEISNNAAFKKMAKGNIAILPLIKENQIELTIGSYYQQNKYHYSVPTAPNANFTTYSATYSRSIYFKSLINKNTLEHEKDDAVENALDKIDDLKMRYENNLEISSISGKYILKYKDYFILAYYLKSENSFTLRKFP